MNTIGEIISFFRKKQNMTQEALANLIGVSAQSVSKWENNTNMPDISLLPLLADIFGCRIDDLFGRGGGSKKGEPERVLDNCCEKVLNEIGSCVYETEDSQWCYEYSDGYNAGIADYKKRLKENTNQRSAVFRPHGMVYYRENLGALLLKRPKEGWQSLLEKEEPEWVFRLLGDRDFCSALAEICRSRVFTFTLSYLCNRCGIQEFASLEEKLKESGIFNIKTFDVDGRSVTVYEAVSAPRLAMLFAVLSCAAECNEYKDCYNIFYGCGIEDMLRG